MSTERKGHNGAAVLTAERVARGLSKVTVQEERALRMRFGVRAAPGEPLPTAHGANAQLGEELRAIELQLFRAMKRRESGTVARPSASSNPAKDKILRALKARG